MVAAVRTPPGSEAGLAEIEVFFVEYQWQRVRRAEQVCDVSRFVRKPQTWDEWMLRLIPCNLAAPKGSSAGRAVGACHQSGARLDFVPWKGNASNAVAWADEDEAASQSVGHADGTTSWSRV